MRTEAFDQVVDVAAFARDHGVQVVDVAGARRYLRRVAALCRKGPRPARVDRGELDPQDTIEGAN